MVDPIQNALRGLWCTCVLPKKFKKKIIFKYKNDVKMRKYAIFSKICKKEIEKH